MKRRGGWSSSTASTASTSPPRAPAAWPRSSPARPCSRRIAAPRSRCAWPTPSAASSNSPRPRPDTRAEVNISPIIRPKVASRRFRRAHRLLPQPGRRRPAWAVGQLRAVACRRAAPSARSPLEARGPSRAGPWLARATERLHFRFLLSVELLLLKLQPLQVSAEIVDGIAH